MGVPPPKPPGLAKSREGLRETLHGHDVIWATYTFLKEKFRVIVYEEGCAPTLAPISSRKMLYEGAELRLNGTWFVIFLFDHVNLLYAIERVEP